MSDTRADGNHIIVLRFAAALLQAAVLYLLLSSADIPRAWPATDQPVFKALLLAALFAPIVVMIGAGQMRLRPLSMWALVVTLLAAACGWHEGARGPASTWPGQDLLWPWLPVVVALPAAFFIAHTLVVDSVWARSLRPPYAAYFDTASKQGLQVVLTAVFVGVFWAVLWLGAALFELVDLDFFSRLLRHRWFWLPATTLAVAASLHLTDVRPALIRGTRMMALTLFSWLLPRLSAIVAAFLVCLPFISLEPLWGTHFAVRLLLVAAVLLIFLINTCYQDGAADCAQSPVRRWAARFAAVELTPLVALSILALALRVRQYGWTSERIFAAAAVAATCCYAADYLLAAFTRPWLKRVEIANIAGAYVVLAIVAALLSPLADPARLMVASQLARLKSGAVAADQFDFTALKFDGARWGAAALDELARSGTDDAIARRAAQALVLDSREAATQWQRTLMTMQERKNRFDLVPAGHDLPDALVEAIENAEPATFSSCFANGAKTCLVRFVPRRDGGAEIVVVFYGWQAALFETDAPGLWHETGNIYSTRDCPLNRAMIENDAISLEPSTKPDVVIGSRRYSLPVAPAGCLAKP